MKFYLIGSRGRLGQAVANEYARNGIVSVDRSLYVDWSRPDVSDLISRYFDTLSREDVTIFVASGLLDPKLPQEDLLRVNYHLPRNVIDGAVKLGIKVITFGTVMEGILQSKNPYVHSKAALGEYVISVAAEGKPAIHVQLHTLFGGGQPSPFMFLGQMLSAIRNNVPFMMTSGRQLREYHHLSDEAKAIRQIANYAPPGVLNLSHGRPLSLRAIAEGVFQAVGKDGLLGVGSLPEPVEENYEKVVNPSEILKHVEFRDSLPAIIQYVQECLSCQGARI